jgi:hypothetical protein
MNERMKTTQPLMKIETFIVRPLAGREERGVASFRVDGYAARG